MLLPCLLIATATSPPKQGTAAPSHALRHDAPKQGPICHAVAFSSLFACRNLVFSSILRAILHTTDIDQRPALACGVAKRDPLARRGPAHLRHGIAAKTSHASGSARPPCPRYHLLPCFRQTVSSPLWHFATPSNPPAGIGAKIRQSHPLAFCRPWQACAILRTPNRRPHPYFSLGCRFSRHPRHNLGYCPSSGSPSSPAETTPKGRGPRSPRS